MTLLGPNRFKPREPWERNLYLLWLAIALTMIGFGGVFPFLPLYIRELGIEDPRQAALWGGIVASVTGLLMVFSAPLWGVIGDRSGRKKNVVRGTLGFAVLMFSASFVPNVYCLLGLWLFLGLLPGPSMAAMPVVTAMAPRHRVQYAVGVLMSASFLGFTVGPLVGGRIIDAFGFRSTLLTTAALLVAAGSIVLFLVRDGQAAPATRQPLRVGAMFRGIAAVARSREVAPILCVLFMVQACGSLMMPVLPLFLGSLSSSEDVAGMIGVAFAIMGVTGGLASVVVGRVGHLVGRTQMVAGSLAAVGLLYVPMILIGDIVSVYVILGMVGFLGGVLVTTAFALVGASGGENQGTAYGAAQSAASLAWGTAPLAGGAIAGSLGPSGGVRGAGRRLSAGWGRVGQAAGRDRRREGGGTRDVAPTGEPAEAGGLISAGLRRNDGRRARLGAGRVYDLSRTHGQYGLPAAAGARSACDVGEGSGVGVPSKHDQVGARAGREGAYLTPQPRAAAGAAVTRLKASVSGIPAAISFDMVRAMSCRGTDSTCRL